MIGQTGSSPGRWSPRWREFAVAALTGLVVLAVVALFPGLVGADSGVDGRIVRATVTNPVPCSNTGAREGVRIEVDGDRRDATLSACGHSEGEQFDVVLPSSAGNGPLEVRTAPTLRAQSGLLLPLALALLALSCLAGGYYTHLCQRGPRRRPVLI